MITEEPFIGLLCTEYNDALKGKSKKLKQEAC